MAVRATAAIAAAYGLAAAVWTVAGGALPGGRWLAVHLFTSGMLTNLVVGLTAHFTETLARSPMPMRGRRGRLVVVNAGALSLLVGLPAGRPWLVALGALILLAGVMWLYVDLRRARRRSLGGRFLFVSRTYERACGAFAHGALLGAVLGVGLLSGGWHAAARLAHLQVMVLGWGGLVLLATVVFFGPTVLRARIEDGADVAAAGALRRAAWTLTPVSLALLATGAGTAIVVPAQLAAAAGLAVYAVAATTVCLPVVRTVRRSARTVAGRMLAAACGWFVLASWANVLLVAVGRFDLLDGLGVVALLGVLGQAILGALTYLLPLLVPYAAEERQRLRGRLEGDVPVRLWVLNAGVLVAAGAAALPAGTAAASVFGPAGWTLVVGALALQVAVVLRALVVSRRPTAQTAA